MSRRRRGRTAGGSLWEVARTSVRCQWCEEMVIQGELVLRVGPLRLACCRRCAKRFRSTVPPEDLVGAVDVDVRQKQIPESDQ